MHLHVMGIGGPIGCLLTHHLRRALPKSDTITILRRNSRQMRLFMSQFNGAVHVSHSGIRRAAYGFHCSIPNPPLSGHPDTRRLPADDIESLLLTTRTYTTLPILQMLKPRLTRASTVVLLQNGMGLYEDIIGRIFPDLHSRPHFVLASHSHEVYSQGFCDVVHTHIGDLEFSIIPNDSSLDGEAGFYDQSLSPFERNGRLSDLCPPSHPKPERVESLRNTVAMLSSLQGLNAKWVPMSDLQTTLRKNLVVRAILDSLSAVIGCANGALFQSKESRHILDRVCREASEIFERELRAALTTANRLNGTTESHSLPRPLLPHELQKAVLDRASMTKGHLSQALSDIRLGKPTDVNYLTGHLLRLAVKHDVWAPSTAMLYNLLRMRSDIPLDQNL